MYVICTDVHTTTFLAISSTSCVSLICRYIFIIPGAFSYKLKTYPTLSAAHITATAPVCTLLSLTNLVPINVPKATVMPVPKKTKF